MVHRLKMDNITDRSWQPVGKRGINKVSNGLEVSVIDRQERAGGSRKY